MALASYFLVITDHREAVNRSAGFLYLLIAHSGRARDPAFASACCTAGTATIPSKRCARLSSSRRGPRSRFS